MLKSSVLWLLGRVRCAVSGFESNLSVSLNGPLKLRFNWSWDLGICNLNVDDELVPFAIPLAWIINGLTVRGFFVRLKEYLIATPDTFGLIETVFIEENFGEWTCGAFAGTK